MPSSKPILGVNDLQSQFPEIAAESYGWDPTEVFGGAGKKVKWICRNNHIWDASPNSRTNRKSGCPYCSGNQVLIGFNDLETKFPDIAAESDGWDPRTVTAGTNQKRNWKCKIGHSYYSTVKSRTSSGSGCPYCRGKQVLIGFNDLQTKFPDIAAESDGWDPRTVTAGTNQKRNWKCKIGHIWNAAINHRTNGTGCPYCSGHQVLVGFNDLLTQFPDIAAEADGWDPRSVTACSNKRKEWICILGHKWETSSNKRTKDKTGCPICSNYQLLRGFNDLDTKFPKIAAEADGWDPAIVNAGTKEKRNWKCSLGHSWNASIDNRTSKGSGCPFCAGQKLLVGFNDLMTRFPEIAVQADGWDPSNVNAGTREKRRWKCGLGHTWTAIVSNRTSNGQGCPKCAKYGFNPDKDAWFYLMQRSGEQQLGITNELDVRMKTHEKNGWVLLEHTVPASGQKVLDTEKAFKQWLKKEVGLVKGTTENWSTTKMEVQSLSELKARSGIETDLF